MDAHESKEASRPPLGLSEKQSAAVSRKPRTKEVTSRYLSGLTSPSRSTPQRCPSPIISRTLSVPSTPASKRSQSAERQRPLTPAVHSRSTTPFTPSRPVTPRFLSRPSTPAQDGAVEHQNTSKRLINGRNQEGLWPSMRGVSASLQLDSYALPTAKKERKTNEESLKATNAVRGAQMDSSARKTTPKRRRTPLRGKNVSDHVENSKPVDVSHSKLVDQHRWVSRNGGKFSATSLTRSVDLTDKFRKPTSLPSPFRGTSPVRNSKPPKSDAEVAQDRSGVKSETWDSSLRSPFRGTSPVRKTRPPKSDAEVALDSYGMKSETSVHSSSSIEDRTLQSGLSPKLLSSRSFGGASAFSRPSRTLSSPLPVLQRPASPTKKLASSRGMLSPSKMRPSATSSLRSGTLSSVSSYQDHRKGKKINVVEYTHQLKLLYNRLLQWRFVNARAKITLDTQAFTAENLLYDAWNTILQLRDSVSLKKIRLQQLKQMTKLTSVYHEQMAYLQDWVFLDQDHCLSLAGVGEALELCTLRIPVIGGARVNVQHVKDAVSCSVDVMQAMRSSLSFLVPKIEKVKSLITELEGVTTRERLVLANCGDLLASLEMMQMEESSLRACKQTKQPSMQRCSKMEQLTKGS